MPQIDLSTPTYRRLLRRARSFDDTGEDVVRRLLDEVDQGADEDDGNEIVPTERFGSRATPGSILPEREYWRPILEVIAEEGGAAPSHGVMEAVGYRLRDRLTLEDKKVLRMGEVRWRNRVRFARLRMREQGLLSDSSPRGIWEITPAGYRFLEDGKGSDQEGAR